ncbi:MAG TPA: sugar transferase [Erysipelotrichaceae bacterium]|nr:sugar transferase [Erysipelotrichaceae bacterium]
MALRYVLGRSTRRQLQRNIDEQIQLIEEYKEETAPLQYDHSKYVHTVTFGERVYLIIKRIIDFVLSFIGIIVLSPVLLILSILVSSNDGGSPIYKHIRVGKEGRKITIYKFRSMRKDAGDLKKLLTPEQLEQYKTEFKIDDDPRITGIGEFIRKTSLDELPQLFNILKGDLSIVGPRPIVEKETEVYGDDIAKFLSAKPGLTGYWQAYARNNATYETGERQAMEMYYIDHKSLWLDIKIFFKTFSSVLKREGAQ